MHYNLDCCSAILWLKPHLGSVAFYLEIRDENCSPYVGWSYSATAAAVLGSGEM